MISRHIVLSAINIYQSGMLTIARDFLSQLCQTPAFQRGEIRVTLFCHRADLYRDLQQANVTLIEKPRSRQSWGIRLFYEYVYFWFWSLNQTVDTWISLHDVSPNVRARRRVVYCHNPMPFYRGSISARYDLKLKLFQWLYTFNYQTNLHKNRHIIVQQQWMREAFVQFYACDPAKMIVAPPQTVFSQPAQSPSPNVQSSTLNLVYPTFPRTYKNYEVILAAMRLLVDTPLRLILTVAPEMNAYAGMLAAKYGDLPNVAWVGFQSRQQVEAQYAEAAAMVFPSKSETWGLPMSEFQRYGKPIFAADLPYAKETLSGYDHAVFLDPDDVPAWAEALRMFATKGEYHSTHVITHYPPPFAPNWQALMALVL